MTAFLTSFSVIAAGWFLLATRFEAAGRQDLLKAPLSNLDNPQLYEVLVMLGLVCGMIGLTSVLSGLPRKEMRDLPRFAVGITIGISAAALFYTFQVFQATFVDIAGTSRIARIMTASAMIGLWMGALGANIGWAYKNHVGAPATPFNEKKT